MDEGELRAWDRAVVEAARRRGVLPDTVVESGTTLRGAATEERVSAAEARLGGVTLPPSYRRFLLLSDGAFSQPGINEVLSPLRPGEEAGLLTCDQVGWLRERDPVLVSIWAEGDEELRAEESVAAPLPEADYEAPESQDPVTAPADQLAHALQVSTMVDGYGVLLNPLVVQADGEWELWDFGTKLPGAVRYRSFGDFVRRMTTDLSTPRPAPHWPGSGVDVAEAIRILEAEPFVPFERQQLLDAVRHVPDPAPYLDDLARLTRPDRHLWVRQAALAAVARVPGARTLDVLLAATAGSPPIQVKAVTLKRLADDPDPRAHEEAIRLLSDGEGATHVDHTQTDILWEAWRASGNLYCLKALAERYDERAAGPLGQALRDPANDGTDPDLVIPAGHLVRPAVTAGLVERSRRPHPVPYHVVSRLVLHHQWDAAFAVVTPDLLDDPAQVPDLLLESLVTIAEDGHHAGAAALLVDRFEARPTADGAKALGRLRTPGAVTALERAASRPRLARACVRALARSAAPGAVEALARLAEEEHPAHEPASAALAKRMRSGG